MAVDMYLVQEFGHDLALRVAEATHAYSDGAIATLLAEDPDLAARRDAAAALLDKLDRARETLDDFAAARAFDAPALS